MLQTQDYKDILQKALGGGASFSEIFLERTDDKSIKLSDSKIESYTSGVISGAGIRVFFGTRQIYAYTNILTKDNLMKIAESVSKADTGNSDTIVMDFTDKRRIGQEFQNMHGVKVHPLDVSSQEKIDILFRADKLIRSASPLITQFVGRYTERCQHIHIFNSEGLEAEDKRIHVNIPFAAVASKDGEKQIINTNAGAQGGYEFISGQDLEKRCADISEAVLKMIDADHCPAGKMPVIIENGFGGVIFHEACGHALETTSVAKGSSVFTGKMGQKIANDVVNAVDDGSLTNLWGSANIDDEGMPTQRNLLIENGVLKSYLVDKLGSLKTGYAPTGSGRREDYKKAPASRMSNTYILPGKDKLDDMLASIDNGLYAKQMGGGSVNTNTGEFNFAVKEGYMIKNGKIDKPVRGASLIGKADNILKNITMISDNLAHSEGMCGSVSGSIPACVGQPAIKVSEIIVGGR